MERNEPTPVEPGDVQSRGLTRNAVVGVGGITVTGAVGAGVGIALATSASAEVVGDSSCVIEGPGSYDISATLSEAGVNAGDARTLNIFYKVPGGDVNSTSQEVTADENGLMTISINRGEPTGKVTKVIDKTDGAGNANIGSFTWNCVEPTPTPTTTAPTATVSPTETVTPTDPVTSASPTGSITVGPTNSNAPVSSSAEIAPTGKTSQISEVAAPGTAATAVGIGQFDTGKTAPKGGDTAPIAVAAILGVAVLSAAIGRAKSRRSH